MIDRLLQMELEFHFCGGLWPISLCRSTIVAIRDRHSVGTHGKETRRPDLCCNRNP